MRARRCGPLYRNYHRTVFVYLCRLTGSPETAEELLQETFYHAIRAAATLRTAARDNERSGLSITKFRSRGDYHLGWQRGYWFLPGLPPPGRSFPPRESPPQPLCRSHAERLQAGLRALDLPIDVVLSGHGVAGDTSDTVLPEPAENRLHQLQIQRAVNPCEMAEADG